jgi:signal transduction histidine kinase
VLKEYHSPGMSKIVLKVLIVITLVGNTNSIKTFAQDKVKNIVVFFSFGSNVPAFENILNGLKEATRDSKNASINIMTEYLDLGRSENDDYARFIITMYNNKLKEFNADLLITVGPGVNDALMKYGSSMMKELNIINVDLNLPGRTKLADLNIKNGKEILLKFKAAETLRAAFALFPEYRNVYVISGVSPIDKYYTSLIRKCENEFEPSHNFNFITDLSLDSTIRFVRTIPRNSVVIVPAYLQDATNIPFSTPEVMEIISRNAQAPVFLTITDAGVKTRGGIGGYLFSYTNLGKETGRIAREILNGKHIQDITVNENSFYEYFYDWKELERWHLTDSKAIPSGSIFFNKDTSFFEDYKWYILASLLFLISQAMIIIYQFRLNRRQKAMTHQMLETEKMYSELIREDRMAKMTELTASLAHELNQPLNAIMINVQAGLQFLETGKLNEKLSRDILERIGRDDKRAGELLASVRSMMKLEIRGIEKVDINSVIRETVNIYQSEASSQHIRIIMKSAAENPMVFADKIQIQQILLNFLSNAARAMKSNLPENKIIEITLLSEKNMVTVSVRDYGTGIDKTIKEHMFDPFITTSDIGFGIGLALCRSIIERHKGEIWAENMEDAGARFSFRLKQIRND